MAELFPLPSVVREPSITVIDLRKDQNLRFKLYVLLNIEFFFCTIVKLKNQKLGHCMLGTVPKFPFLLKTSFNIP